MKKILISLLLILVSAGAFAQAEFAVGAKGGLAGNFMPQTTVDLDDTVLPNLGFYGGVFGTVRTSDFCGFQLELLYARKGVCTKGEMFKNRFKRNIHYIDIPVLYSMRLLDDRFFVMAGPEFGFALGSEITNYVDGEPIKTKDPAAADALNVFNVGVAVQASYLVFDNLGVDLKFDHGLTRTFKDAGDKGRNLSVQVGLSYFFGF